ncbi:MAG: tyrosine-type recombinase/integrase, partial [Limisphaerales bacterium]
LEWSDLKLDRDEPVLVAPAAITKNSKEDVIPLHPVLAEALRELRSKSSDRMVFSGKIPTMKTFRADLKKAGIEFVDSQGRRADFHAFRHTLATMFARLGVAPRVAMEAMRHSEMKLTMKHYTDATYLVTVDAFNQLPSFTAAHTQKNTEVGVSKGQSASPSGSQENPEAALELASGENLGHSLTPLGTEGQNKKLVAGVGFEPTAFRL